MVTDRAAYHRDYNKVWKAARRKRLIEMLGGCCVRCGATEDLEFDHIDPSTKAFTISGLPRSWDALVAEAAKCQLLCKPCHVAKGAEDRPELAHGTFYVYQYWNCRCEPCKAAKAARRVARGQPSSATSTAQRTTNDGGATSATIKNRAAYHRDYNKAWKAARRKRLIEMLGGRCVRCGATEDLEFDHIDPSTKVFAVCAGLSKAWDVVVAEAAKCQLLCRSCHVAKGATDRPAGGRPRTYGHPIRSDALPTELCRIVIQWVFGDHWPLRPYVTALTCGFSSLIRSNLTPGG